MNPSPDSALTDLLEEAFPADWNRRSETAPADRLRGCLTRRDDASRQNILRELHDLLDRGLCEMQMSELIAFELGCHLRPADMGLTASEWLAWVGRQVASE